MPRVSHELAIAYRLTVNNIASRLPAGSYIAAAHAGLQDTAPRDALLALHARVEACEPSAWEAPGLIQTYSPRQAVYVLPERDFGVFTVGRLPRDPDARQALEDQAEQLCHALDGREELGAPLPELRSACATGRIALRWTTSALHVREYPRPQTDPEPARMQLCRRHLHAFGPTTAAAFAWWAGVPARDAKQTFHLLSDELTEVDFDGHPAWLLAEDLPTLIDAAPMRGVRLLPAPDLRLFGQDATGLFAGPGLRRHSAVQDTVHPNGLLVDGRIAGAWGRRGGRVTIKAAEPLSGSLREAVHAEAESMPIPLATVTVSLTVH